MAVEVGTTVLPIVAALVMTFAAVVAHRRRRTNSGYFTRTVTLAQLLLSLRDPSDFKSMYRLEFVEFEQLHTDMCRSDPSYFGDPRRTRNVDSKMRLLSGLRFMAGGDPKDVAKMHGQSKASFWRHIRHTLKVIIAALPLLLPLDDPAKLAELEKCCCCGRSFGRGAYRGCIGWVDGLIVPIEKPECVNAGEWRCNRKDCFGINCQGVCDGKLRFTYFAASSTGGTHDSAAFLFTSLGARVDKGHGAGGIPEPFYFGGDAAYKSGEAFAVPVAGAHVGSEEDNCNYVHSQFRSTIERAFGALIRRFGVFWRPLNYDMKLNLLIIRAAVRLHNICMNRKGGDGELIGELASAQEAAAQPTPEQVRANYLDEYVDPLSSDKSTGSITRDCLISSVAKAGIFRRQ